MRTKEEAPTLYISQYNYQCQTSDLFLNAGLNQSFSIVSLNSEFSSIHIIMLQAFAEVENAFGISIHMVQASQGRKCA